MVAVLDPQPPVGFNLMTIDEFEMSIELGMYMAFKVVSLGKKAPFPLLDHLTPVAFVTEGFKMTMNNLENLLATLSKK